jgi:hypothetical protein
MELAESQGVALAGLGAHERGVESQSIETIADVAWSTTESLDQDPLEAGRDLDAGAGDVLPELVEHLEDQQDQLPRLARASPGEAAMQARK